MVSLEHRWRWRETSPSHLGHPPPPPRQPLIQASAPQEFQLTPWQPPRTGAGAVQLPPVNDLLSWLWDASPVQTGPTEGGMPHAHGPLVAQGPPRGIQQLTTGDGALGLASPCTPPGLELTVDTATENLASMRPEGPIQASHHTFGGIGQGGDACLVPCSASRLVLLGVSTGAMTDTPAFGTARP